MLLWLTNIRLTVLITIVFFTQRGGDYIPILCPKILLTPKIAQCFGHCLETRQNVVCLFGAV